MQCANVVSMKFRQTMIFKRFCSNGSIMSKLQLSIIRAFPRGRKYVASDANAKTPGN